LQVSIDSEINISDDILLAVAMNGLKPELKTIVMTKVPKNVEELRHCATLAEKALLYPILRSLRSIIGPLRNIIRH
jgi:hypothetical protein